MVLVQVLTWALGCTQWLRTFSSQSKARPSQPQTAPQRQGQSCTQSPPQARGVPREDTELLGGQAAAATSVTQHGVRAGLQGPARPQPGQQGEGIAQQRAGQRLPWVSTAAGDGGATDIRAHG